MGVTNPASTVSLPFLPTGAAVVEAVSVPVGSTVTVEPPTGVTWCLVAFGSSASSETVLTDGTNKINLYYQASPMDKKAKRVFLTSSCYLQFTGLTIAHTFAYSGFVV